MPKKSGNAKPQGSPLAISGNAKGTPLPPPGNAKGPPLPPAAAVAAGGGADVHGNITMDTSAPARLGKSRACLWTLNNYTSDDISRLRIVSADCRYICWGYELAPTTGTPHLQGFVCWKNERSLDTWADSFSNHMFVKRPSGTHKQNRVYCQKPDTKDPSAEKPFEEYGELPEQGKRTDWEAVLTDLKQGKAVGDVIEEHPHLLPFQRAIRETKNLLLKPIHREVNVFVLCGEPGSGKTRWAYDKYPDLYAKPPGEWWDGYAGEKCVLLDDFYGWVKYHDLLRVLDRYPLSVPIKGGFVNAQWDTVVITSNAMPWEWYKSVPDLRALKRRIKSLYLVQTNGDQTTYEEIPQEADWPQAEGCRITSETYGS